MKITIASNPVKLILCESHIDRFLKEMKEYLVDVTKVDKNYHVTIDLSEITPLKLFHAGVMCGIDAMTNYKDLKIELDYSKIDRVELEGIDYNDYPDFCDAYIAYAEYDGREMTEMELEVLNNDSDYVYDFVIKRTF